MYSQESNKRSPDDDGDNVPPGSVSGMSGKKNIKKKKSSRRSYLDDLIDMYTPIAKSELKQMMEITSCQLNQRIWLSITLQHDEY